MIQLYYIYALVDPRTNKVMYVGCTKNPEKRFYTHMYHKSTKVKDAWIKELKDLGLKPKMTALAVANEKKRFKVERRFIHEYWKKNEATLNIASKSPLPYDPFATRRKVGNYWVYSQSEYLKQILAERHRTA